MTVISGQCLLVGSPTKRFPKLADDPPNDVAQEDTLVYTNISTNYHLSVKCFEFSMYSLTVSLKRTTVTTNEVQSIDLMEGLLNKYSMSSQEKLMTFYIQLDKPTPFEVSVNQLRGKVWFEVYPSISKVPQMANEPWTSKHNRVRIDISGGNSGTEFIVIVHSEEESYFTIQYSTITTCNTSPVGRSIRLNLLPNDYTCIGFSLNRHANLDIVFSTSGFEMELNQLTINRTLGGESKLLTAHTTRVLKSEL